METKLILLALIFLSLIFECTGTLKSDVSENISQKYQCICPGLSRPVCTQSPSGRLNIYNNYCHAACLNSNGFKVLSRSDCSQTQSNNVLVPGVSVDSINVTSEEYINNWVEEIKEEAAVYKQINRLLYSLLELSSVPGASSPCTCAGIHRAAYKLGPSGTIVIFDNACTLRCYAMQSHDVTAIYPSNMKREYGKYDGLSPQYNETLEQREERELNLWIAGMEEDIAFYRRINAAMDGIFNYDKNDYNRDQR